MVGNDILKRLTLNFDTSKALQAPQMNITRRAKLPIIYSHNTILSSNIADTFPLFWTLKKTKCISNCEIGNRVTQTSTILNQILVQDLPPSFPCVLKVGHAHGGLGKVKVEGETSWKDLARFFRLIKEYFCTIVFPCQRGRRVWTILHRGGVRRREVRPAHLQAGQPLPCHDVGWVGGGADK